MIMSCIWTGLLIVSILYAVISGTMPAVSEAVLSGAQSGFTLAITMAGSLCLWSGVAEVMKSSGLAQMLSRLLSPITKRIFPNTMRTPATAQDLCANICANFLGLGNAATPLGIRAVQGMVDPRQPSLATDEMCRFIVLNTASIQLIPANVAAVRASLGCSTPFDILGCVWITSVCSAGLGLIAAFLLGKVWHHD